MNESKIAAGFSLVYIYYILFIFGIHSLNLESKIRIMTFQYNRPDFVEYQYLGLSKFLKDDFELYVVNDAPNSALREAIQAVCNSYPIIHIDYSPHWHIENPLNVEIRDKITTPRSNSKFNYRLVNGKAELSEIANQCSVRHAHLIDYVMDKFGYCHDDLVVILDGDVFPLKPFSFREISDGNPFTGLDRESQNVSTEMNLPWVACMILDPAKLPNFREMKFGFGLIKGILADTGSQVVEYFEKYPGVPRRLFPRQFNRDYGTSIERCDMNGLNNTIPLKTLKKLKYPIDFEFFFDGALLHIGAGAAPQSNSREANFNLILNSVIGKKRFCPRFEKQKN